MVNFTGFSTFTKAGDFLLSDHLNQEGLANSKGIIIIPVIYKNVFYDKYDLYLVESFNGKKGYYSKDGISYFKK